MTDERSLSDMRDHASVSEVILQVARSLDVKDWESCRRCFLDEIETDYSDLRGEPPSRVKAADFVAKRQAALGRLKTQHLSTNHLITVDGDRATCVSAAVIHRLRPMLRVAIVLDPGSCFTRVNGGSRSRSLRRPGARGPCRAFCTRALGLRPVSMRTGAGRARPRPRGDRACAP